MLSATLQTKVTPKMKKDFTAYAKSKKKNVSSLLNELIEKEMQSQNRKKKVEEFKKFLAENKMNEEELKSFNESYDHLTTKK
jgi:predicted transcriptional regulator